MAEEIEVAGLVTRIAIDDTDLEKSMAELNRTMKLTQSEFKKASSGLTDFGKGSDGLKLKSDSLSKQLQTQGIIVAKLKQDYDKAVESGSKNADQLNKMEIRLNKAATEYNNLDAELKKTTTDLDKQQKDLIIANSNWTKLGSTLDSAGKKMQDAGKKISDSGKTLTVGLTAPLVAIAGLATKASIDFESAFAGVRKTVDATEAEFSSLETGIRDMSKEIPAAATEIAKVAEAAGQLGIKKEAILGFTRVMVDLGNTTNLSSDQAATALARLANITQMPQDQFDELGATVVQLGNKLATTEAEIVEMGLRLAGAGKQIGLTEAQILGFAGALSSVGIEAEAGGSAFSRVMIDISSAVQTGSEDLNTFAAVAGQSTADFRKSFQQDAAGAIVAFVEGLGRMSESGENTFGVLDELGLSEIRVRDALLRTSNAGDLLRDSIDLGSKAWEDNTALVKEAEQRYTTNASKLQILKNRLTDVGITLGDALIPAFTDALDAMEPLFRMIENTAKGFANLDSGTQKIIISVVAFAAALGPVLYAVGKVVLLVGRITTTFAAASTAVAASGTAAAGAGVGFTALLGPVGLAIAAVAALTVAGIALYKFFSKDGIPSVQRFGDEAEGAAQRASGSFEQFRKNSKSNLEQTASTAKTEAVKIGNNIATGVGAGTKKAKDAAVNDMKEMVDKMKETVDQSASSLNKLGDAISDSLKKQYDEMEKSQTDALDNRIESEKNTSDEIIKTYEQEQSDKEKALDKQLDVEKKASDDRLKVYDREYTEKLKLIDKESYDQIKAIQDQIDGIDNQTDAEEKALKEQEHASKLAELQKQLLAAETAEEREKVQQELNRTIADYDRRQLIEQRNTIKDGLKDQIEVIEDLASEKKDALKQELEDRKEAEKDQLQAIQDGLKDQRDSIEEHYDGLKESEKERLIGFQTTLEDEKKAVKEHYAGLTTSEALQAESRKLIVEKSNDEIIRLLETYNPKWQDAGQSFADSFSKGLDSEKQTIAEAVKGIVDIAPAIDSQVQELDKLQTKLEELQEAAQSSGGGGGGVGIDLDTTIDQAEELIETLNNELAPGIEGVTEASKEMEVEALKSFIGLNDKATVELNLLKWSGGKVSEETATSIVDTFFGMGNTIQENLQTSHADQLRTLEEFFKNSSTLTEEEEAEALRKLVEQQGKEAQEIEVGKLRVSEIFSKALDDHRALTQQEWDEVTKIQGEMTGTAERTLGEHELAQKTILEQMKADADSITARQAADVVKNSKKQKDESIIEAEEQYSKVVAEIIRQRDESKTISAEQADALIADAKRQRDESVKYAEEMHDKVVEEAELQAGEHAKWVDWETGEVLTRWGEFKKRFGEDWEQMKTDIGTWSSDAFGMIKTKWDSSLEWTKNLHLDMLDIGKNAIQGLIDGFTAKWESLKSKAAEIGTSIKDAVSGVLLIKSPSRVMMQLGEHTGEGMAIGLQNSLANIKRQAAAMAVAAIPGMKSLSMPSSSSTTQSAGSSGTVNHYNFERMFDGAVFPMSTPQDIRSLAKELGDYILSKGR